MVATGSYGKGVVIGVVLAVCLVAVPTPGAAIPAPDDTHTLTQPDGTEFEAVQWGDEWQHGWETQSGYTIVENQTTGWWYYATVEDGDLTATDRRVGIDAPAGLEKHLRGTRPAAAADSASLSPAAVSGSSHGSCTGRIQRTGDVNLPVLMANFSDTTTTTNPGEFQRLLFGDDPAIATGPGSLQDYYEEASYGALNLTGGPEGVSGWYTAAHEEAYYGNESRGRLGGSRIARHAPELVEETVRAADADGFDFSQYDNNGDGCVAVVVIHQGAGDEETRDRDNIWSHRFSLAGAPTTSPVQVDGVTVNSYSLQPATGRNGNIKTIGTIAHETGHLLGLPDLYDTTYQSDGIGSWGLMGSGNYNQLAGGRSGDSPAHPTVWSKAVLGWSAPTQIPAADQAELLPPQAQAALHYRIGDNADGTGDWGQPDGEEYFLVSNRQLVGFDRGLPGSGMLVWHVNESQSGNDDESNKLVDLEAADGNADLDASNGADPGDPFPGQTDQHRFADGTTPSANWRDGSQSGIDLRHIEEFGNTTAFNEPTNRSLDARESAVYAVPVMRSTPDRGFVSFEGPIDVRAVHERGSSLGITLVTPRSSSTVQRVSSQSLTPAFERTHATISVPPSRQYVAGGWKLFYNATSGPVNFTRIDNYPEYPLPSSVSVTGDDLRAGNASSPNQIELDVTVETGDEPYRTGPFGALNHTNVHVSVGGERVPENRITVTTPSPRPGRYHLKFTPPNQSARGTYDLTVGVSDTKVGVSHRAQGGLTDAVSYTGNGTGSGSSATVLVVDDSGSMIGSKITAAKSAAKQYGALLGDSDEIAVVRYDSGASTAHALSLVGGNRSAVRTSIDGLDAGGGTDIGEGLNVGYREIVKADASTPKAAILLTDGKHNGAVDPTVADDQYANSGIPVYTIALGSGADESLLRTIANETHGTFSPSPTSADLAGIYANLTRQVTGASTIATGSGSVQPSGQVSQTFSIDESTSTARVRTELDSASGSPSSAATPDAAGGNGPAVRLQYPNGTVVPMNQTATGYEAVPAAVNYTKIQQTHIYRVTDPNPGAWTTTIRNDGSETLDYTTRVTGPATATLSLTTGSGTYVNGSMATLTAQFVDQSGGITGASVTATITRPDGTEMTATLAERRPGVYTTRVPNTANGTTSVTVAADAGNVTRQRSITWSVVDASSVLDIESLAATTPSGTQGDAITLDLDLSRPAGASAAPQQTGESAAGEHFDAAVGEVAASEPGTYEESAVDPATLQAARVVRNETGPNATASAVAAAAGSTGTTAYLRLGELTGPGGATISAADTAVSPAVVSLADGQNRTVTVRIDAPNGVTPGTYTGTLEVLIDGTIVTHQVTVDVTRATRGTFVTRIVATHRKWLNATGAGKTYYEKQMADQLTRLYFGSGASDGESAPDTSGGSSDGGVRPSVAPDPGALPPGATGGSERGVMP